MATERDGEGGPDGSGALAVAEEGLREARGRFGRFWNGTPGGVPLAAWALAGAGWRAMCDRAATRLHGPNLAHLGAGSRIVVGCSIRYPARVSLGERVLIGRRVTCSSEIPEGRLEIGDGSWIDVDCVLDFTGHLVIGRDCTVSARTRFFSQDHGVAPRSEPVGRDVRLGDRVWIGTAAVILQNASEIGDDAVIAAGSVVTKPVPPPHARGREPGPGDSGTDARLVGAASPWRPAVTSRERRWVRRLPEMPKYHDGSAPVRFALTLSRKHGRAGMLMAPRHTAAGCGRGAAKVRSEVLLLGTRWLYKIVDREAWARAGETGVFEGAPVDLEDGYIHLSTAEQVRETARRHFEGEDDLVLVAVPEGALADDLRWEPSRGGELFPHCYAPLPTAAAERVVPLCLGPDGLHGFPDEID